ncbi:MAG: hypothetical protein EXQ70_05225 [Solirubrobacterales bacterium]|nr:hypothetical protein [Solirubrobacterales bacterium]
MFLPIADLLPHSIGPYLAMMILGFVLGTGGHLYKSKTVVAIGIGLIFLATLLLPLAVIATEDEPPSNPSIYAPGTR